MSVRAVSNVRSCADLPAWWKHPRDQCSLIADEGRVLRRISVALATPSGSTDHVTKEMHHE